MYLSVFLGPFSPSPAHDATMIDLCLEQAEAAAAAGFAMVTFGEQHLNGYEPYANPFLMGARLSPVLGACWFGTTIVPLPLHPVLRLAEDSAILDVLTKGRFVMGMSAGRVGFSPDFRVFGADPDTRYEAFASKLELLQAAYTHRADDPPLSLDTPWDSGTLVGRLMPTPHRVGGPRLAVGTNTPATVDDVARRGLPLFLGPCEPAAAAALFTRHRDGMTAAGHDATTVAEAARLSLVTRHVILGATEDQAWERAETLAGRAPMLDRTVDRRSLRELNDADPATDEFPRNVAHVRSWITAGTPETVTAALRRDTELGIGHLNVRFTVGPSFPDMVRDMFGLFRDEVLPALDTERFPAMTPTPAPALATER